MQSFRPAAENMLQYPRLRTQGSIVNFATGEEVWWCWKHVIDWLDKEPDTLVQCLVQALVPGPDSCCRLGYSQLLGCRLTRSVQIPPSPQASCVEAGTLPAPPQLGHSTSLPARPQYQHQILWGPWTLYTSVPLFCPDDHEFLCHTAKWKCDLVLPPVQSYAAQTPGKPQPSAEVMTDLLPEPSTADIGT